MNAEPTEKSSLKSKIEAAYWDQLLEHGEPPASVYRFCKQLGISEGEFFKTFSNFDVIESSFWEAGVRECREAVEQDEDSAAFTAPQWLSAFYFTYFEWAVENRSKLLLRFPKMNAGPCSSLKGWNKAMKDVADEFVAKAREEGSLPGADKLHKAQSHAVVLQARALIDFHLQDASPQFQDTDALVEKSVRFVFEATRLPLIDSAVDLMRFVFPRLGRS